MAAVEMSDGHRQLGTIRMREVVYLSGTAQYSITLYWAVWPLLYSIDSLYRRFASSLPLSLVSRVIDNSSLSFRAKSNAMAPSPQGVKVTDMYMYMYKHPDLPRT